jgi:hypothetical protein
MLPAALCSGHSLRADSKPSGETVRERRPIARLEIIHGLTNTLAAAATGDSSLGTEGSCRQISEVESGDSVQTGRAMRENNPHATRSLRQHPTPTRQDTSVVRAAPPGRPSGLAPMTECQDSSRGRSQPCASPAGHARVRTCATHLQALRCRWRAQRQTAADPQSGRVRWKCPGCDIARRPRAGHVRLVRDVHWLIPPASLLSLARPLPCAPAVLLGRTSLRE